MATNGLLYSLSSDGEYYTCKGMGTATDTDIEIADYINGIPVKIIGVRAFEDQKLTSIKIPNTITDIYSYAFSYALCNCKSDIVIPDGVLYIGDYAFAGCFDEEDASGKSSIIIGDDVTTIGTHAFSGSGAKTIKIGDNVQTIGEGAFFYCFCIQEIIIPDSVTSFGDSTNTTSHDGGVFAHCIRLENVYLGANVRVISPYAFYGCTFLNFIELGNNIKTIKEYAFFDSGLYEITMPASVSLIENYAFDRSGGGGITKARMLGSNPPALGEGALGHSWNKYGNIKFFVPKLSLNDYIEEYSLLYPNAVFYYLESAATVNYNGKVLATLNWHDEVVLKTANQIMTDNIVVDINIPCVMTYNGGSYVYDTNEESLDTGDLANGLWFSKTITFLTGSYLESCYVKSDIVIKALGLPSKSIKYARMSDGNGYGVVRLTDQTVKNVVIQNRYRGEPVTYMQSNFCKDTSIKSVFIPGSIKRIGAQSFYNCTSLSNLIIEEGYEGVEQIISSYFCAQCKSLEEIIIPSTVKTIQNYAFRYCENLKKIFFNGPIEKWKTVIENAIGFAQNAPAEYVICTDGNVDI